MDTNFPKLPYLVEDVTGNELWRILLRIMSIVNIYSRGKLLKGMYKL